jgi:sugar-specific transcriptional regulator TrmB
MIAEDEFAHRLTGFGLTEKEALVYLHLLRYGPSTQSRLAKALKTYREDVRRTLNSLIAKSIVCPSVNGTAYAPVDLDAALEAAMKKQESVLLEMEAKKRELKELAKQQLFRPLVKAQASTFKGLKSSSPRLQRTLHSLSKTES